MRRLVTIAIIGLALSAAVGAQVPQAPASAQPTPDKPSAPQASSALEPQGYTYNPAGRRDPFVSLLRRGAEVATSPTGPRPPGIAGLAVAEVSLRGTVKGRDGFVAMLQGADNKTYLVRPGDKLLDGTVRSIAPDSMVLLQSVNDPLSLETQREVRKVLRQAEGAK
jgi:type IV pilus assembly protein PilP